MKFFKLALCYGLLLQACLLFSQGTDPLMLGIAGLSHDHVNLLFRRDNPGDIDIVGIAEPNKQLVERYFERYKLDIPVYVSLEEMLSEENVEAVSSFGSTFSHLEVVEKCAPQGIHVMVEKPLAVSLDHALKIEKLANEHQIHVITNYETTWYPTNHKGYQMFKEGKIGAIRKILVNDGHKGPKEINVSDEFLEWLSDPVLNGGGALMDFGCYGANLSIWLMEGQLPISVSCITQTNKPDVYPNVDDEATIILQYEGGQTIIQASWNWPFNRKDMEIYGVGGKIVSHDRTNLSYRLNRREPETSEKLNPREYPYNDPFSFFAAVVKRKVVIEPFDLSSLENNLMVIQILEAAKKSAETGKKVYFKL